MSWAVDPATLESIAIGVGVGVLGTGGDGNPSDGTLHAHRLIEEGVRGDVPVAIVRDLICIVDVQTVEPITTRVLRYGLRIAIPGMSTPLKLRS